MNLHLFLSMMLGLIVGLSGGFILGFIYCKYVKEPKLSYPWTEKNGVIYLPEITSDGTTGPQWITRLEKAGHKISDRARFLLNSSDFKPTTGTLYNTVILKGELWSDVHRITKQIRTDAQSGTFTDGKPLFTPNTELACWLRLLYTNEQLKQMGLVWIITMHEPINDSVGDPDLLGVSRDGGDSWLSACDGSPGSQWDREDGFAFAAAQVSSSPQN